MKGKMMIFFLVLLWLPSSRIRAFSVSAPAPSNTVAMSNKAQRRAMNSIWHYTKRENSNPAKALILLEKLLKEEQAQQQQSSPVLKRGVVWNVLIACRFCDQLSDVSCKKLESSLVLLQNNPRLYQANMTEFTISTLAYHGHQTRAQSVMGQYARLLCNYKKTWDQAMINSAKSTIWLLLNKNENKQQGAEYALLLLEKLLQHDTSHVVSTGIVVNVLKACQQYPTCCSVDTLEHLLPLLRKKSLLNAKILNQVLIAMTKCTNGMSRAESIVKQPSCHEVVINTFHYNSVLSGYAQRGSAKQARQLLQSMTDRNISQTVVTYNTMLHALYKSTTEPKAVERAETIWRKMKGSTRPDYISYTNMMNVYSKHGMGIKAQDFLQQMKADDKLQERPSGLHYRSVIDALAKSGHANEAECLLNQMRNENMKPNLYHYCGVLNGFAREGRPLEAERVLEEMQTTHHMNPNNVAYNCVMYAWTKSDQVDAPFRAKALVDRMKEQNVAPTVISYNCLLGACARRSMAKEAERLLKQMHELYDSGKLDAAPNVISYNYVLDSLARSGDRVWTVLRAETLINKMKELYSEGEADTKPNMISYRSLLKCYCNWNLPRDADQLLRRMEELHENGELEYGPDRVSYRVVIDALSKSELEDDRDRAAELKKEVEERYGQKNWSEETVIDMGDQMDALLEYMRA